MSEIQFISLNEVDIYKLHDLMNNDLVRKQMPLFGSDEFSIQKCKKFILDKNKMWDEYGFGPRAIVINNHFAGWGGIQPEGNEADFALVLHPKFWGWGFRVFKHIKKQAFQEMKLDSITALLPPSRQNQMAIKRLGFQPDGQSIIDGTCFIKFRFYPS